MIPALDADASRANQRTVPLAAWLSPVAVHQTHDDEAKQGEPIMRADDPASLHHRLLSWLDDAERFAGIDPDLIIDSVDKNPRTIWSSSDKDEGIGLVHDIHPQGDRSLSGLLPGHDFISIRYLTHEPVGTHPLDPDASDANLAQAALIAHLRIARHHIETLAAQAASTVPGHSLVDLKHHAHNIAYVISTERARPMFAPPFETSLETPWSPLTCSQRIANLGNILDPDEMRRWASQPAITAVLNGRHDGIILRFAPIIGRLSKAALADATPIEAMRAHTSLDQWVAPQDGTSPIGGA